MRPGAAAVLLLLGTLARAEGLEKRQRFADTVDRLYGAATMFPMPRGGLVTLGGSKLRVQEPGKRTFESLFSIPGDSVYRVALGDDGSLLAAWEKDPSIHYFTAPPRRHVVLQKPASLWPDASLYRVEFLALLPDHQNALVFVSGERLGNVHVNAMYRVPLDGSSPAQLLYSLDSAVRIQVTASMAVFVIPQRPGQMCENLTCDPVASVDVYELTPKGVLRRTLVDGKQTPLINAHLIRGSDDHQLALELATRGKVPNQHALLRWRPGEAKPSILPLERYSAFGDRLQLLPGGEVLSIRMSAKEHLELKRLLPDGSQRVTTLPAPGIWQEVTSLGLRSDGRLWMHWGDWLLLFSKDLSDLPRAYPVEPLLLRHREWAGVGVYLAQPEALWLGIEAGGGRDFARVSLAEAEQRARPWSQTGGRTP